MPKTPSASSPAWKLINVLTTVHVHGYKLLGGRLGTGGIGKAKMLLLDHVGAKSGKRRTSPLVYLSDEPRVVLIASKGGTDRHPAWFHNLKANPRARIQVGSQKRDVVARVATPEEHATYWPQAVAVYGGYADYKKQADSIGREIPIVILDPA